MAQLPQIPQIKNGKPDFSPTFQKVELRNSTFFQQLVHCNMQISFLRNCSVQFKEASTHDASLKMLTYIFSSSHFTYLITIPFHLAAIRSLVARPAIISAKRSKSGSKISCQVIALTQEIVCWLGFVTQIGRARARGLTQSRWRTIRRRIY